MFQLVNGSPYTGKSEVGAFVQRMYEGHSTDEKPYLGVAVGSYFRETDTDKEFVFNDSLQWEEIEDEPVGTLNVTENGTYDVTEYAGISVAVEGDNMVDFQIDKIEGYYGGFEESRSYYVPVFESGIKIPAGTNFYEFMLNNTVTGEIWNATYDSSTKIYTKTTPTGDTVQLDYITVPDSDQTVIGFTYYSKSFGIVHHLRIDSYGILESTSGVSHADGIPNANKYYVVPINKIIGRSFDTYD